VSRIPWRKTNASSLRLAAVCVLVCTLVASCSTTQDKTTIRVLANSTLVNAFSDIADQFEIRNPDVHIEVAYGNSNAQARQITQGADADVFASAEAKDMRLVKDHGDTAEDPTPFVTNRLAIITPRDNPANIQSLKDLARPGVQTILPPIRVPSGHYARVALKKAGIANEVDIAPRANDVVSAVGQGNADAGICYVTDVTPALSGEVFEIVIPDRYNVPATYEIAPLDSSDLVVRFTNFVLSTGGQGILAAYGFGRPPAS
jgi:molybdate transport system substrate-binding protein